MEGRQREDRARVDGGNGRIDSGDIVSSACAHCVQFYRVLSVVQKTTLTMPISNLESNFIMI